MQNDKPVIFFEDGIPMTTSLEVARLFDKQHKNVMEVIRSIDENIPNDFNRLNFRPVEIIEKNASGAPVDKSRYHITEDGFMFIGMKLGGKKADLHRWKVVTFVKILQEEIAALILQGPIPTPQIEAPAPQIEATSSIMETLYRCAHCKGWFPFEAFNRDNGRNPPVQAWCRECHKKRKLEMKNAPIPLPVPEAKPIFKSDPPPASPRVLALVRHNPPKANQRSIPEADLTEDKQMILRLIRSQREVLDIIESRALMAESVKAKT